MRRMQKFIGVADTKPASAPIHVNNGSNSHQFPTSGSSDSALAPFNLQVPSGSSQQNQLTASHGSAASSLRGSNPPSPSAPHREQQGGTVRSTNGQPQYFDYLPAYGGDASTPLQPPQPSRPLTPSSMAPVSPGLSQQPTLTSDTLAIERGDLHRTLKAIEGLLVNLDEYRDLASKMAKVEKKLARSAQELEKVKSVKDIPSQTLQVSAAMFEALHDVSSKHAKQIQKEYEALNESCAKYFKKVAKEERAHDELLENLDAKIKKANAAHEKNIKKAAGSRAVESHDKYISTVQGLTAEISKAKVSHSLSMGAKSHTTSLIAASTIGGLSDLDFRTHTESVRKVGPYVGKLNEWLSFASSEAMPVFQPADLDETEMGHAQFLLNVQAQVQAHAAAQAEAQARAQEDVQAAIRAQQMGWLPPTSLPTPAVAPSAVAPASQRQAVISMTDLPKLDQHGNAISEEATPLASAGASRLSADRISLRSQPAADNDAVSVHSVRTMNREEQQQPERKAEPAKTLSNISRESREEERPGPAALAPSSQQQGLGVPGGSARLDRAPTGSTMKSMAVQPENWESGSFVGHRQAAQPDEEQEEKHTGSEQLGSRHESDNASLHGRRSSSNIEGTVVDRLGVPREPSDLTPSLSHSHSARGSDDGRAPRTPDDVTGRSESGFLDNKAENVTVSSPTKARAAERALDRYKELGTLSTSTAPRYPSSFAGSEAQDEYSRARKLSLWERERERENEIQMRLREEQYTGGYATPTSRNGSSYKPGPLPESTEPYDPERYAPSVGRSRLSGVSVSRSLSTDTTASERSFVARMKARYQAEKELEKEQRELNVLERERAARLPPQTGARRVTEMASRYTGAAPQYAQGKVYPTYHDTPRNISSPPASEFGSYQPHSDVCGCQRCSARHYTDTRPPASRSAKPREANIRRQSMPLQPPSQPHNFARRSFEDAERKVAFAHSPQTIR